MLLRLWMLVLLVCVSAFAPSRACAREAETLAWVFAPQSVETRLEAEPQAAGTHQENGLWNYEHAPGCTQAAERAGGSTVTTLTKYFPENSGFIGATERKFLMPGEVIDRFGGSNYSRFFSPQGVTEAGRALPPASAGQPLRSFEVLNPFEVNAGTVAPAFGEMGFGTQFVTPVRLEILLKRGIIREVTP